ncbi:MAG: peptidylprolyl isomerase [Pseudomonadota bacterium]
MSQVKSGDTVKIHYTGSLANGRQFDSSDGRDPLQFEVGSGQMIPGLDSALPGMEIGDKKRVEIDCQNAYGPIDPDARHTIQRSMVPDGVELELGKLLQLQAEDGQIAPAKVVELDDETVTLDRNHPLAGFDLVFEIELVSIG